MFVNTPHNPTGSVMAAGEQRKLAEALAARGIPLIVDEVYHPLYFARRHPERERAAQHHRARRLRQGAVASRGCASAGSSIAMRSVARRCSTCAAISRSRARRSPKRSGAHALAHAPAILAAACGTWRAPISRCSRGSWTNTATCSGGRRPRGGTTCFPWLRDGRDARPLCEALAKAGVLAAPGDCFDMPAHLPRGIRRDAQRICRRAEDLRRRARGA